MEPTTKAQGGSRQLLGINVGLVPLSVEGERVPVAFSVEAEVVDGVAVASPDDVAP